VNLLFGSSFYLKAGIAVHFEQLSRSDDYFIHVMPDPVLFYSQYPAAKLILIDIGGTVKSL
jgi:hypothetical protein